MSTPQIGSYINLAYFGKNSDYKFDPFVHQHPDGDYGISIHGLSIYLTIEQMQTLHAKLDSVIREHEQKEAEKHMADAIAVVQEASDEPSHPIEHPAEADDEVYF